MSSNSNKKTQPNMLNFFNTRSFLEFMRSPKSVGQILDEYTRMTEDSPTTKQGKTLKSHNKASALFLRLISKINVANTAMDRTTATNSTSYDASKYRCTEHPTEENLHEFWKAVLDQNTDVIVALSTNDTIYRYWGLSEGSEVQCNELKIKTIKVVITNFYTKTLLQLEEKDQVTRGLVHFHYTGWPSDNMSHSPMQLTSFISTVNDISTCGPMVVSCSDGNNKCGVFCLLDMCIAELKKEKSVFVSKALRNLRQVNKNAISQPENYIFCYNALYNYVINTL